MKIIAYVYSHPLLEKPPESSIWGWEIDAIYQDIGQRSQWHQLLQDCQQNPPNYLLVRRLEELGETLEIIQQHLLFLESLHINIIVLEQPYDSRILYQTDSQTLRTQLTALFQEIIQHQRQNTLKKGHAKNRMKALPPPGKAPYGYRRGQDKYIIDRSAAPILKAFFEHFLLYASLRSSVKFIEKKYGKKISVSTGKKWLTHPVYRGDLIYKNKEIIPDTHVPLLSREEAAQIDRILRRNQQFSPRTASAPRSLAGLVKCQMCQAKMMISSTKTPKHTYLYLRSSHCPLNPPCKAIDYQFFLEKTITKICKSLPQAVAKLQLPNLENIKTKIEKEIENKMQIINLIKDLQQQGILDEETAPLRIYKLKTEISQLQSQLNQLPPDNLTRITQAVSLEEFWLDLSEQERRFYFREFIKSIEILRQDTSHFDLKLLFVF